MVFSRYVFRYHYPSTPYLWSMDTNALAPDVTSLVELSNCEKKKVYFKNFYLL